MTDTPLLFDIVIKEMTVKQADLVSNTLKSLDLKHTVCATLKGKTEYKLTIDTEYNFNQLTLFDISRSHSKHLAEGKEKSKETAKLHTCNLCMCLGHFEEDCPFENNPQSIILDKELHK